MIAGRIPKVVVCQGAAFLVILGLHLSRSAFLHDWKDALPDVFLVALVAIPALVWTWRISLRLHYLEHLFSVCSWCHRIRLDGDWVSIEEFMDRKLHVLATHGICPRCQDSMFHEVPQKVETDV